MTELNWYFKRQRCILCSTIYKISWTCKVVAWGWGCTVRSWEGRLQTGMRQLLEVMDSHYLHCGDSTWVGTMSKPTKLYNLNINMFSLWYVNFTSHFFSVKKKVKVLSPLSYCTTNRHMKMRVVGTIRNKNLNPFLISYGQHIDLKWSDLPFFPYIETVMLLCASTKRWSFTDCWKRRTDNRKKKSLFYFRIGPR